MYVDQSRLVASDKISLKSDWIQCAVFRLLGVFPVEVGLLDFLSSDQIDAV